MFSSKFKWRLWFVKLSFLQEVIYNFASHYSDIEGRIKRKTRELLAKYNAGKPVAAGYFQAKYDDYVAQLRAQFPKWEWEIGITIIFHVKKIKN